ncbi:hypothetical protein ATY81_12565 [Rhizobium sp. R72]|uniref:hypothetical protein n=1 Tax=unclassified Rhizobium TaxID=2613769 RepID=UPI000B53340C|nr:MULTISPECIES: hypothetical protein [unclassified Rhizobium]OWV94277.1 hypothetical protein ATY81_12565 [Rhizobium sp. R72]OWV94547.1 hypothetical protein ATY80_12565 [Rhizobium sp. R711]
MGITIDNLSPAAGALGTAFIPVFQGGATLKLTVAQVLALLVDAAPGALDTLNELAAALGDDPNFAATIAAQISTKLDILQPYANVASAATVNLGAQSSQNLQITGTTGITSFGTAPAGTVRNLRFAAALTLTHNATSLILPNNGKDILTAANDTLTAVSLGSGNWFVTRYQRAGLTQKIAILQDQKASGTAGGASSAGWQTRTLNTEVLDADNIVTLSSNVFTATIDCEAWGWCQGYGGQGLAARFWNVTDSVAVSPDGVNGYSNNAADYAASNLHVYGLLTAGKSYRLEMFSQQAKATNGLGVAGTKGTAEIFAMVLLKGRL